MTASEVPEAPALTREHIKKELDLLHQKPRRARRSALFARLADKADDGATVDVVVGGESTRFRIVATSGELDLRQKLAKEEEPTAYVVSFSRRLPRDIEASLAGGRLFWPQIESLLPRRFGAKSCTPRMRGSKLRLVAQREGTRTYAQGEAPSIDLDDAWLVLLRNRLGLEAVPTEAQAFAAVLLDRERRGKSLAAVLAEVKGAREELGQVLDRRLGASARWIVAAWLDDAAVELAAMAVVGEAVRAALGDRTSQSFALLMTVLEMRVRQVAGHPLLPLQQAKEGAPGLAKALVDLGYLVPLFWPKLEGQAHDPLRRAIVGEAETLLALEHLRPLALGSDRLPFVFAHRCKVFLEAIDAAVAASDKPGVMDVVDRTAADLLAHDGARGEPRLRDQVEMATRLAAFLGEPVAQSGPVEAPHAEVVRLSTFQAEAGGWVDWARQVARDDGAGPLGKGLFGLIAAVDRVRDALDARFAAAYARVLGPRGDRGALSGMVRVEGRHQQVLPIEEVLARMGLVVLARSEELKLLVLCMDGMSWANLAELWGSIARTSFVPVSRGPRAAVLAHVPTITRLSRSALFAGRALLPGEPLDTTRDGERLAKHATIRQMNETPVVLLRGDVLGEGGGLSDDANRRVRGDERIVAVVVNAIDDQLKGSVQLRVTLSVEHILPLKELLKAAEDTGRLVLLVSDHGNVNWQRFVGAAVRTGGKDPEGMDRGARHRFLRAEEAAAPDEIELPVGALAGVKGVDRVAVAVHEAIRYTPVLHAGEHGGASLGEVVAPAVLLAPRGLLPTLEGLDVDVSPLEPPAFWTREVSRVEREVKAPAPPPPPREVATPPPAPTKKTAQVSLPFEPPPPEAPPELVVALFRSPLYKEQIKQIPEPDRPHCQKAIELLVRRGGRMARDPFAVALGIDTAGKGVRVPGFLSKLERVLNVDQEPVVEMDSKGQIITLDAERLRVIFLEDGHG
ncbi:BREX-2 system phosphatase PglZ [Polyangium jinanense]|uniref:BREX-2 system phosphatase PglZ n=1 Tax=Polyangium jinanense TaxID=2829994 RepID=UPI00234109DF|nr:BREX-2 system phosphatase PglZ [Polyangium jinanense]MDC3959009.1 BREX-2 system phosphatase PglZ [Polyangium jinanense]